jgi:hypothetical protein
MSPDKQRIAIAEACGWKCPCGFKEAFACWVRPSAMDHQTEWLPDYLVDLNAMHEALKTQPIRIQQKYIPVLRNLCAVEGSWPEEATAAQRAEAFLHTIGKWEDDK